MKKINRLFALLPLIAAFVITACSNEEEIAQNNTAFEGYTFKVNAYIADGTRASGDTAIKTKWEVRDVIYFVIDNKVEDILTLTYDTVSSTWDTKPLNNAPEFAASGSVKAVYADVLSYDPANGIRTKGDIITTENGTYTKDGNVIQINLPMNNRPVMKVTILGVPDAFPCIKDFRECTYLDFSTMKFKDDGKFGLSNREQAISYATSASGRRISGAYNYYGYFDDNVTGNFSLATANMSSFWVNKNHTAASLQKGYAYVAKGPDDKVGINDWDPIVEVIPVAKSTAMTIWAGSVVRMDSLFGYQYGNPEKVAYNVTSSNNTVLTPISESEGKTWILKAIENEDDRGSSLITVSTDVNSAQFNVSVDERKSVDGIAGLSFKVDSIIKRIVADNPTNAFSYCANEFFAAGSTSAYTYTSENEDVATISDKGIITMKEFTDADVDARGDRIKAKNVIITAKNNQNGLQFSFNIRVQEIDSYITATWGAAAYLKEAANSHGAGVQFTMTNGLGRNVYGMKASGSTLTDVKDITVNSIKVAYPTGTSSAEKEITTFYQVGSKYSPATNVLKAGEKGTGYYDLDGTPLTWHINSTATIKYTYNGKQYEKQVVSGNAKPE